MYEHKDLNNIEVGVLQDALERSGLDLTQAAQNIGWDLTKLRRTIGLDPNQKRDTIPYELAVRIVEACHFDPVDYGL